MKAEREIISEPKAVDEAKAEFEWPEPQSEMAKALLPALKALAASDTPKLSLEEIEEYLGRKLGGIAEAFPDGVIPCTEAREIAAQTSQPTTDESETKDVRPAGSLLADPPNPHGSRFTALAKAIDEAGIPRLTVEEIEDYLGRPLGGIAAAYPNGKR